MGRRIWTDELIVETIRALHRAGVDLSPTSVRRTHPALFSAARSKSHFGSWRAAVEAAGLDYESIKRHSSPWTTEEVIRALREAYERGEDLLSSDFKRRYKSLYTAARSKRCFGSWREALKAAGLDYEELKGRRFWTKRRIIERIRELHAQGIPLNWSTVDKISPGLYRAARRKENFGSWRGALEAAGVEPQPARATESWSKEKIVRTIRELFERGEDLSQKSVAQKYPALLAAAKSRRYFGSWGEAVRAAGIDYESVKRKRGRQGRKGEPA